MGVSVKLRTADPCLKDRESADEDSIGEPGFAARIQIQQSDIHDRYIQNTGHR